MPVGTGCVSHRHIIPLFVFFSSKSMYTAHQNDSRNAINHSKKKPKESSHKKTQDKLCLFCVLYSEKLTSYTAKDILFVL